MNKEKNKGFSLIELIVVIAIMAVLVGVLAPAYLRYVEKARQQTCYYNMDNVVREVQLLAYSDPEYMDELEDAATDNPDDILPFVSSSVTVPHCPSNGTYTMTFNSSTGVLTMECSMNVHGLPSQGGLGGEIPNEE
ncbi:MAG: pilin [Lachnospiraceae bacterium]|nr:pilin [Lachnospiraceae bacterium]